MAKLRRFPVDVRQGGETYDDTVESAEAFLEETASPIASLSVLNAPEGTPLHTRMSVVLDDAQAADTLTVNEAADEAMLPRLSACLDRVAGPERARRVIDRVSAMDDQSIGRLLDQICARFAHLHLNLEHFL